MFGQTVFTKFWPSVEFRRLMVPKPEQVDRPRTPLTSAIYIYEMYKNIVHGFCIYICALRYAIMHALFFWFVTIIIPQSTLGRWQDAKRLSFSRETMELNLIHSFCPRRFVSVSFPHGLFHSGWDALLHHLKKKCNKCFRWITNFNIDPQPTYFCPFYFCFWCLYLLSSGSHNSMSNKFVLYAWPRKYFILHFKKSGAIVNRSNLKTYFGSSVADMCN